jgi:hypothetical protein
MRVPMHMMTEEEKKLAKDCAQLYFMRSTDVPPSISAAAADDDFLAGGSDNDSVHDMDISTSRSRVTLNILVGQAVLATQQSQADDVQFLTQSRDHKYQVANGKLKEALKIVEDDPVQYQHLFDAIDKIRKMELHGQLLHGQLYPRIQMKALRL